MSVLVIAEHDQKQLKPATLATVTAAKQLGGEVHLLVLGHQAAPVAQQAASISGVTRVIHGDSEAFANVLAENFTSAILAIAGSYKAIVAPATTFGKNLMPRVAAKLDIQQISDVIAIENEKTFVRPIYAGNALLTLETTQDKNILTVRPTNFALATSGDGNAAEIETRDFPVAAMPVRYAGIEESKGDRPELTAAKIVVSGGRGVGSKENFALIEQVADTLGAAVGASRAAVDAGYVPNDYQVGQTGKIVAPDLYIAAGISGAIQHLAGIGNAKVIVAINKDPDAPIFSVADYGLVGDLFQILPEFIAEVKK